MNITEQYQALADAGRKISEAVSLLESVWAEPANKGSSLDYEFKSLKDSVFGNEKTRGIIEVLMKRLEDKEPRQARKI